jgi:hypothetical protein
MKKTLTTRTNNKNEMNPGYLYWALVARDEAPFASSGFWHLSHPRSNERRLIWATAAFSLSCFLAWRGLRSGFKASSQLLVQVKYPILIPHHFFGVAQLRRLPL